jgi:hypothetical protein
MALVEAACRFGTPAEWKEAANSAMAFAVSRREQFSVRLSRARASMATNDLETAAADLCWLLEVAKDLTPNARTVVAELVAAISIPGLAATLRALYPAAEDAGMGPLVEAKVLELDQLHAFVASLPPRGHNRATAEDED